MSTFSLSDYSGSQDSFTILLGSNVGSSLPSDLIASALENVNDRLQQLALDPNGFEKLDFVFDIANKNAVYDRLSDWGNGIFPDMPEILVLANTAMNGAAGAYSAERNTIYIAESLVQRDSLTGLEKVLTEEYGHSLDRQFNPGGDSTGDEGELFSNIVLGEEISDQELARLRGEDDRGILILDGIEVAVEFDNSTSTAVNVGTLSGTRSYSGFVGSSDTNDYYRFSVANTSNFSLSLTGLSADAEVALLDRNGRTIVSSTNSGSTSESISRQLNAGTYYARVYPFSSANTNYNLSLTANTIAPPDNAGNSTGSARNIGTLSGTQNFSDFVGSVDTNDYYRFSVANTSNFSLGLTGLSADAEVALLDSNGGTIVSSTRSGTSSESISRQLNAGTYYARVYPFSSANTNYNLSLTANSVAPPDDFAANTSTTGSVTVGGSRTGVVEATNDRDWFRISLQAGQAYRFNLNGNTLGDPTLTLRDGSGNQLSFNDDFGSGRNSQITYTASSTGSYYLDAGAYSAGTGSYTLTAINTSIANDDYAADTSTTGTVTIGRQSSGSIDFVGDRDWLGISLQSGRTYRFDLSGNTLSDPTLSLWDSTGGTILASNDNFGSGRDSQITFTTSTSGTYFLDAGAIGSLLGTYNLSATDTTSGNTDRITGLQDSSIRQSVNTALNDNLFTHQELTSLLRNTATAGVTSAEFSDLRLIANNLASYLSATSRSYTQYIFNAITNGNTANQWWTGGNSTRVSLGNLSAGSSEQHLNRLVDKWFGGNDLPTNFVGGDSAAGASSLTFTYGQMTGNLFVNGISFDDINQGQAGTCYFLAAASTLANNQNQFIQDMFRDNGDGTYGVRFYGTSGNEIWVTVNRSVPVTRGRLALAGNSTRSLTGEMWVALAEKAYAQANEIGQFGRTTTANSFRYIEGGLEDALTHISNRPTTTYSAYYTGSGWTSANRNSSTWNSYLNAAIAAVNAGRSLWIGSFGDTYDSSGKRNFVSGHALAITGYNASTQRFTIANPWGAGNSSFAGVFESTWSNLFNIRAVVSWA